MTKLDAAPEIDGNAITRLVRHDYSADDFETLCGATSPRELFNALGYLSSWAGATYPFVRIYIIDTAAPEMQALYRRTEGGAVGYAIAAVWNGTGFGFHS